MYTGKKTKQRVSKHTEVQANSQEGMPAVGELVALNCQKYNEQPQIAEVTELHPETEEATVLWWQLHN